MSNKYLTEIDGNLLGLESGEVLTIKDSNAQPKLTAGDNITIDENNIISALGGGGSGSGYSIVNLWNYINDGDGVITYGTNQNLTLNDDVTNYDSIIIENVSYSGDIGTAWGTTNNLIVNIEALKNALKPWYVNYTSYGSRSIQYHIEENKINVPVSAESSIGGIVNVYGIKFSKSGGEEVIYGDGYIKYPDGLLVQYGHNTFPTVAWHEVSYPIPFIDNDININVTQVIENKADFKAAPLGVYRTDNTKFEISLYNQAPFSFDWRAIGKWK